MIIGLPVTIENIVQVLETQKERKLKDIGQRVCLATEEKDRE